MKLRLFLLVCLLIGGVFSAGVQTTFATSPTGKKGGAYEVISLVNQLRAARGLAPYQANSALMAAAQAHSEYQASIGSITHSGAGGSRPADRAVAAGYGGGLKVYVSENIYGGNNASPQQAVGWWQGDSLHLTTLISPNYVDVGVGVAVGGNTVYYTLDAGYVSGSPGNPPSNSSAGSSPVATSRPAVAAIIPIQVATPAADGSIVHIVQQGQALWNIAAAYKIELSELLALNGLTKDTFIYPGDKIIVRQAKSTPTATLQTEINPTAQTAELGTVSIFSGGSMTTTGKLTVGIKPEIAAKTTLQTDGMILPGEGKPAPEKSQPDFVLLAIGGLVILGTSLILIGSLGRRSRE